MSAGKTYWWAKDAAWLDREAVVELGVQFGPGGPLVLDALCGMAKLENDAGRVFTGLLSLARKTFTEPDLVHSVVVAAAALGALDDLEFDEDGRRFRCRISGWQADQTKGRTAHRVADLVREAQEELADAANYLAWEFRAHDTSVHQALGAVVQAWAALEEVRRHG